jgi:diaminopimelate epimerase
MIPFAKYHGLGNDFLVVDLRAGAPAPSPESADLAKILCDRRFGVGGDGVLAILPASAEGADCRMRVINSDGSEAEMCGNGIRCVAKHLYEHDATLRKDEIRIETLAGVLACGIRADKRDKVASVSVAMGRPRLTRAEIPMVRTVGAADRDNERCVEYTMTIGGRALAITAVSMGNPHAVAFVPEKGDELRALATRLGPQLETHDWFPRRTNAEFAHVHAPDNIELVVWERGCGITLACGTGACATAVAACLTGRSQAGKPIQVWLPGGPLTITVAEDYSEVTMNGPAAHVFDARIDLAALLGAATTLG